MQHLQDTIDETEVYVVGVTVSVDPSLGDRVPIAKVY